MLDAILMEEFPETLYSIPAAVMRQGCRVVFDRVESYIQLPSGFKIPIEYNDSKRQWTVRVSVSSVGNVSIPHIPLSAPTEKQVEQARPATAKRVAGARRTKRVRREGRMQHSRLQHRRTMHGYGRVLSKIGYKDGVVGYAGQCKCECEVCLRVNGKHASTGGPVEVHAKYVGEITHTDTLGPLPVESKGGCKYQLVCIDEFAGYSRVYNIPLRFGILCL